MSAFSVAAILVAPGVLWGLWALGRVRTLREREVLALERIADAIERGIR